MQSSSQHDRLLTRTLGGSPVFLVSVRQRCIQCTRRGVLYLAFIITTHSWEEPRSCSFPLAKAFTVFPLQLKIQSSSWMDSWETRRARNWLVEGTMDINSQEFSDITKAKSDREGSVHGQVLIIKKFFQAFNWKALNISSASPNLPLTQLWWCKYWR